MSLNTTQGVWIIKTLSIRLSLRHSSILRRIWFNFTPLFGFHPTALSIFRFFFRISNLLVLNITEETWVVEMRIWCIKIGSVLDLHYKNLRKPRPALEMCCKNVWKVHEFAVKLFSISTNSTFMYVFFTCFIFVAYICSPSSGKCNALYLRPKIAPTGNVWFDDVAIGVHQLQQIVSKMCKEAGFGGFFTNHSLRATSATRLYAAGVDEQLKTEKAGHRSCAICNYKRTSESVSDLIQKPNKMSPPEPKKV
jgi:hypothetical protein